MEYIISHFPYAEISIIGDFNVHEQLWLSSSFTDQPGEQAFNLAICEKLHLPYSLLLSGWTITLVYRRWFTSPSTCSPTSPCPGVGGSQIEVTSTPRDQKSSDRLSSLTWQHIHLLLVHNITFQKALLETWVPFQCALQLYLHHLTLPAAWGAIYVAECCCRVSHPLDNCLRSYWVQYSCSGNWLWADRRWWFILAISLLIAIILCVNIFGVSYSMTFLPHNSLES